MLTGQNNNALPEHNCTPKAWVSTQASPKRGGPKVVRDSQDESMLLKLAVRESEDEFSEQENVVQSEASEYDTDAEQSMEVSSNPGSPGLVVIAPVSVEALKQQQLDELNLLSENPYFHSMMSNVVDVKVSAALAVERKRMPKSVKTQPKQLDGRYIKRVVRDMKSPSDTTIYAPALKLTSDKGNTNSVELTESRPTESQISQFLHNVRLGTESTQAIINHVIPEKTKPTPDNAAEEVVPGPSHQRDDVEVEHNWEDDTRDAALEVIATAEKMKVQINAPKGIVPNSSYSEQVHDEFFHITFHVDSGLRTKIE